MNTALLASHAQYPQVWITGNLLVGPFFEQQALELQREYGSAPPPGGTEHWRYAGFLHWLRQVTDVRRLELLLQAAAEDPDPPMAGNVVMAIIAHPLATTAMLERAVQVVNSSPDYYVSAKLLHTTYQSAHASA